MYVEEYNRIIGIVTLGNLRRHILEGADLINTKFSSVKSDNVEEIEKVFDKSYLKILLFMYEKYFMIKIIYKM